MFLEISEENESTCAEVSIVILDSWSVAELRVESVKRILFSYVVTKFENGINCAVTQKSVTLDVDRTLNYYVYGRHVNQQEIGLDRVLNSEKTLPYILIKFKEMNICNGLGDVNVHFIQNAGACQDFIEKWRSKDCSLICKTKRCNGCVKCKKGILQRMARLKNRLTMIRIREFANPIDKHKLSILRIRNRREKRQKFQAEKRVKQLMTCITEQRAQIAKMQDSTLDARCAELNIPASQKLALKEIIAASKKNAKGRRYTKEWIMLCMLMNIRSPGYYEFLRKNSILPLPCTRTIRSYFSLINAKCGFDKNFAKLLQKHFASKTPLQRNGILLLDEIIIRKSIAVCSKNLTYVGLTDFGKDEPQSSDINEQATHGLVLMFQPLADVYTQPIAVFASKNPVKGDKLAKLVVKAISYLEQCDAIIHGIIADGAATNMKMWSLLDVRGTMEDTKT